MSIDLGNMLLDALPDAIAAIDVDGRILWWNRAAQKEFGYARSEAVGSTIFDLIVPPDAEALERQALARAARGEEVAYESVRRRRDGVLVHVRECLRRLDAAHCADYLLCVMEEVMHAKVARSTKLLMSRFGDLVESTPDAMVIVNAAGDIVLVNSQTEALFGYRREELLGQGVDILVPERSRSRHAAFRGGYIKQPHLRAMGTGFELSGRRKDGSEFPVEVSLSPLPTEDGLLVSSAIRDVTERKKVEQTLREASRMKSEFLANMSHELRTPLNGIIGFSEFLYDERPGTLNAKQKEYLSDILTSGRHLLELINGVLDLSKVEAGRMELHPEVFALDEIVDEACSAVSSLVQKKAIDVTRQRLGGMLIVDLDRQKLMQVLLNLLSNAVKFTPENGRIAVTYGAESEHVMLIRVEDSGIGIRSQDLGKLFVEFQQIDSGTARRYGGTGLGLALVKRIVELQGGWVDVKSEPGRGSAFTVRLPLPPLPGAESQESST